MECDQERELATHAYPLHVPFHASCTCLQLHTRITQWLSWHTHTHSIVNGSLDDKFENWQRWNNYKSTCQKSNNSANISVNSFPQSGVEGVKHIGTRYTRYSTLTTQHNWKRLNTPEWLGKSDTSEIRSQQPTGNTLYLTPQNATDTYVRTYVCPRTYAIHCTWQLYRRAVDEHDRRSWLLKGFNLVYNWYLRFNSMILLSPHYQYNYV